MEENNKIIIIDDSLVDMKKMFINLQLIMWSENIKNLSVDFLYITWKERTELNKQDIENLENKINNELEALNDCIKPQEGYNTNVKIITTDLEEEKYKKDDSECKEKVLKIIDECKSNFDDHYAIILDLILNEDEDVLKFFNPTSSEEILSEKIIKEETLCGKVISYTCWDDKYNKLRSKWFEQQIVIQEDLLNKRQITSATIFKPYKDKLIKILKGNIENE